MDFLVGGRAVLDAPWNNNEFAFLDCGFVVAEFHPQRALHDQKHFVFVVVMVPDELAAQFDGLDLAIIHLADDPRAPIVRKAAEFFF